MQCPRCHAALNKSLDPRGAPSGHRHKWDASLLVMHVRSDVSYVYSGSDYLNKERCVSDFYPVSFRYHADQYLSNAPHGIACKLHS